MDAPRGRIVLAQALAEGLVPPTDRILQLHLDRCLACRACEVVCPSGVQYGAILELARAQVAASRRPGLAERLVRGLVLGRLIPARPPLRVAATGLWLYQRSGLQRLVRGLHLLPAGLAGLEALLPPIRLAWAATSAAVRVGAAAGGKATTGATPAPAAETRRPRVAFFSGCVQDAFLSEVNRATVSVLLKRGFTVVNPPGQTCCGALHGHLAEHEMACDLARRNIRAFAEAGVEAVVVNAGGCGAHLKTYGELLAGDPDYAAPAAAFAAQVFDLSEFLVAHGRETGAAQPPIPTAAPEAGQTTPLRVTYADSCHLRNAQRVVDPPRQLIRELPGVEYVELEGADHCCGSAGVYNLVHPDIAGQLLQAKVANILKTGAEVVITTNTGCHFQIQAGLAAAAPGVRVMHLAELLDECEGGGHGLE